MFVINAPATPPPCRTLGEYVAMLVQRLSERERELMARLRTVVGERRARIGLDAETIEVHFDGDDLVVTDVSPGGIVDGTGSTDRDTTLELLAGRLEVADALLEGRIQATGEMENLVRIFTAIEILLDGACRNPGLQKLSLEYQQDPCREAPFRLEPGPRDRRVTLDPAVLPADERMMLKRLDLLP